VLEADAARRLRERQNRRARLEEAHIGEG
jgi:hypothetical protein